MLRELQKAPLGHSCLQQPGQLQDCTRSSLPALCQDLEAAACVGAAAQAFQLLPSPAYLQPSALLLQVVTDFFDELKSRSRGYASMEYHVTGYKENDLVRLDIMINSEVGKGPPSVCCMQGAGGTTLPWGAFCLFACSDVGSALLSSALCSGMGKLPSWL